MSANAVHVRQATLLDVHALTERLQVSTMFKVVDLLVSVLGQVPEQLIPGGILN